MPTAETAAPLVLNLRFPDGGDRDLALALALEFLVSLGGAALPAEFTAEPRPEPVHGGTDSCSWPSGSGRFAPWAGFRNRMVERLSQLRRARIDYPGQEAAAIEEERRTRGSSST